MKRFRKDFETKTLSVLFISLQQFIFIKEDQLHDLTLENRLQKFQVQESPDHLKSLKKRSERFNYKSNSILKEDNDVKKKKTCQIQRFEWRGVNVFIFSFCFVPSFSSWINAFNFFLLSKLTSETGHLKRVICQHVKNMSIKFWIFLKIWKKLTKYKKGHNQILFALNQVNHNSIYQTWCQTYPVNLDCGCHLMGIIGSVLLNITKFYFFQTSRTQNMFW